MNKKPEADENDGGNTENAEKPERPKTQDTQCSICLEEITDMCHTDMCKHLFCYKCLKQWSTIQSFCPLCKTNFNGIHHSFTEHGLYQVHNVPVPSSNISMREPTLIITGMTTRRAIYNQNMWAEPLPDLNGRFRGVSSQFFEDNPEQTIRVHEFVRREVFIVIILQINEIGLRFNSLNIFYGNIEFVTNLIIILISVYEIMEVDMVDILQRFLGRHALHFCHELYNFANSLYDNVVEYDYNVRYSGEIIGLPNPETALLDSDDEENIETTDARRTPPEVNILEFSSDESDDETIGITSRPIETYDSSSADQPSTLTGNQHSVERSNNSYIHTSRRFSSVGTRIVYCPSSDDESTSDKQTVSRTVCGKRKRRAKTNTNKKMKKSTGEQQNIVGRPTPLEMFVFNSSSDESDVETIGITSRPIETYDSSSADQPSTSTGIQHSVERSNNRYIPTSRRFSSIGTRFVYCPSSDDESISDEQTVSRTVCGKRKRRAETNTNKKMKKSTGEQLTIVGRKFCSESSSSDEEDV